jgi:hypothetical protein
VSPRLPASASSKLRGFRARLHGCFGRRSDALFELCDAILTTGTVPSPAHLSLAPVHRRGWGSLYAALREGTVAEDALRDLLAREPLLAEHETPGYAVDVSAWPRCDAEASPARLLLQPLQALGRPTDRGRLGIPARRQALLRARLVGGARGG